MKDSPCQVGKGHTSGIRTSDDDIRSFDSDVHVVDGTLAFFLAVFNDLRKDVLLAGAGARKFDSAVGAAEDVLVAVEDFLDSRDGDKAEDAEEGELDHDASGHGKLL